MRQYVSYGVELANYGMCVDATLYDAVIMTIKHCHVQSHSERSIMFADQAAALDPLLTQARELLLAQQNPSVAFLQRHLKIGYNRAMGLLQSLEGDVVTPPNADGWRRMVHSGKMSPSDPQHPDYKPELDTH